MRQIQRTFVKTFNLQMLKNIKKNRNDKSFHNLFWVQFFYLVIQVQDGIKTLEFP